MNQIPLENGWTHVFKSRDEYQSLPDERKRELGLLCWAYTKHLCKPHYPSRDGSQGWANHIPARPQVSTDGGGWSTTVRNEDLARFTAEDIAYFEGTQQ